MCADHMRGRGGRGRRFRGRGRGLSRRGRHLAHQELSSALEYGYSSLAGPDFPPLGSVVADFSNNSDNASSSFQSKLGGESDVKSFFMRKPSFDEHFEMQKNDKTSYAAAFLALHHSGLNFSQNVYVRALAAAWARHDHALAESLLASRHHYSIAEVLKAVLMLDSSRRIRVQEKKIKRLQLSNQGSKPKFGVHVRAKGKCQALIRNLKNIKPKAGSASGALCRHVQRWVRGLQKEELEFSALHFPKEPWKTLADLCHLHPEKDFPEVPWFLPYCFGGTAPKNSLVEQCQGIAAENVNALVMKCPIPYAHIKKLKRCLSEGARARIASYTPKLDTVLWHYEDLQCEEVDKVIQDRLLSGDTVSLPTGKFLERLLMMKLLRDRVSVDVVPFFQQLISMAEERLTHMSLPLEAPVVVMGDRSGSMEVAIRTSTIIASILTAVTSAKLVFFDNQNMETPFLPRTVTQALDLAGLISTGGGTCPAASLYPFYWRKEVIKTFIIVTDEEENDPFRNFYFDELFKKYHREVYPAQIVFVSFLERQHDYGDMVLKLEDKGIKPIQFKLDRTRPDLSKLDKLFGMMSHGKTFEDKVTSLEHEIRENGVKKVFSRYYTNLQ